MSTDSIPARGGDDAYLRRMQSEKDHFDREYKNHGQDEVLVQHVPPVWQLLEQKVEQLIRAETGGYFLQDYIAQIMNPRSAPRMISLASGPCGLELDIAGGLRGDYEIVCVDINQGLLDRGIEQARRKGLRLSARVADCNRLELEEGGYDVVMAFASLHHFVELENIFPRIARALRPGGVFVTMDISSRNGYLMWDDTLATVRALWSLLPDRLKINHTRFQKPTLTPDYENVDYGDNSFECVRSQDILGQLDRHFEPVHYVSYYAFCRRFFDPMYGPNYDLNQPLDKAFVELAWALDQAALSEARLPPETFFGVFRPVGGPAGPKDDERRLRIRRDIHSMNRCLARSAPPGGSRNWLQKIRKRIRSSVR